MQHKKICLKIGIRSISMQTSINFDRLFKFFSKLIGANTYGCIPGYYSWGKITLQTEGQKKQIQSLLLVHQTLQITAVI